MKVDSLRAQKHLPPVYGTLPPDAHRGKRTGTNIMDNYSGRGVGGAVVTGIVGEEAKEEETAAAG